MAARGTTLRAVLEDALRARLAVRPANAVRFRFAPPVVHGSQPPVVDPADRNAVRDLTFRVVNHFLRVDGQRFNLRARGEIFRFLCPSRGVLRRSLPQSLDFFRPGVHPWDHPARSSTQLSDLKSQI